MILFVFFVSRVICFYWNFLLSQICRESCFSFIGSVRFVPVVNQIKSRPKLVIISNKTQFRRFYIKMFFWSRLLFHRFVVVVAAARVHATLNIMDTKNNIKTIKTSKNRFLCSVISRTPTDIHIEPLGSGNNNSSTRNTVQHTTSATKKMKWNDKQPERERNEKREWIEQRYLFTCLLKLLFFVYFFHFRFASFYRSNCK